MFQKKRLVGALVLALILAVTIAGVAVATPDPQTQPAKDNLYQDFIAKFSANLGVDQEKVTSALEATKKQMLDEAVQSGKLTQEQADQMAARMNGDMGWHMGWFGGMYDKKGKFGEGRGNNSGDLAKAIGITEEQLKSEFESGKKLSDILTEKGLDVEQLHQKMLEIKKEALAQAVTAGKLTQDQADKMLQRINQHRDKAFPETDK